MDVSRQRLAGAAQVDITPQGDIHLSGSVGEFRPAQLVLDPLYARALVLKSGETKLCLVSLDLTIITEEWTRRIRAAAEERIGVASDAVMVHVTQTHSAPSLGHFMVDETFPPFPEGKEWLRGGDPRYFAFAFERIIEAIVKANAALQPVRVRVGSGVEGRLAFNRRAVMNDGRVYMPGPRWPEPLGPTRLRYLEGPIDPEVGVMAFQNERLEMVAMLLHYTCHPVNVFPKPHVSADWPGAWCREMRAAFDESCVPLVVNGCCGNINPWDPFDPEYRPDHGRMGRMLAQSAQRVLETAPLEDGAPLAFGMRRVRLPIRDLDPVALEQAQGLLSEHPNPQPSKENPKRTDLNWVLAASLVSVHLLKQRSPTLDYEIQALRIGRAAIVGLPGEPFVEGQLRIKMGSPLSPTYVAHCTTHYVGYVPTKEAFARGGHEVDTRFWSKLAPGALDVIVENAVALLHQVHQA